MTHGGAPLSPPRAAFIGVSSAPFAYAPSKHRAFRK